MKTDVHLWQYLPKFFLESEIFRNNFVEKIKTGFFSIFVFVKIVQVMR